MTSPNYGKEIRESIDDYNTKHNPHDYGGHFFIKDSHGTAHISLIGLYKCCDKKTIKH